jgi:hypothetical protein
MYFFALSVSPKRIWLSARIMFSLRKKDKITSPTGKIMVIPHPQWPVAKSQTVKKSDAAAIRQRRMNPVMV